MSGAKHPWETRTTARESADPRRSARRQVLGRSREYLPASAGNLTARGDTTPRSGQASARIFSGRDGFPLERQGQSTRIPGRLEPRPRAWTSRTVLRSDGSPAALAWSATAGPRRPQPLVSFNKGEFLPWYIRSQGRPYPLGDNFEPQGSASPPRSDRSTRIEDGQLGQRVATTLERSTRSRPADWLAGTR